MSYYIKRLIPSLLFVLACIVSCTSEPDYGFSAKSSQEEMKFEVAGQTRTIATTNENFKDTSFMLFGDVNLGGSGVDTIFYWHDVTYKANTKKWDYGTSKQYWFMGQEHSFVAIHPFISSADDQVSILDYTDSKLSFTYQLPEKLEDAKDLLFATHRRKYSLENQGPVRLEFTHLLARINISMALIEKELMYDRVDKSDTISNPGNKFNKDEYIKVHGIEFHGIKTRASFEFTAVPLEKDIVSTYDYKMDYMIRDNDRIETVFVTLSDATKIPNSYKEGVEDEDQVLEYFSALKDNEIVVMLPQSFGSDSDAKIVVNYSINEDNDLTRRINIPLKDTTWKEGVSYTYKFLIDNAYYGHIIDQGIITVDIDDFRLHGDEEVGDDSWITDDEDEGHNIKYGYEEGSGNSGPI